MKRGFNKAVQRFYCKQCKKYFQGVYTYKFCTAEGERDIIRLNNEGMSISSISRIIKLSKATIIRKMKLLAANIKIPEIRESGQVYEMDEMQTYIGKNEPGNYTYIIYAINKVTKQVISLSIGKRTKENIKKVTEELLKLSPKKIMTDKLNIYPGLIPQEIHSIKYKATNHIERKNLTLRTHLKRLSRRTICFSRTREMLECSLRLYLWQPL